MDQPRAGDATAGDSSPEHVLFLMRHATAENFHPGGTDHARDLTEAGRRQSELVGAWLRTNDVHLDAVLASSSQRTRQTVEGIAATIRAKGDARRAVVEYRDDLYNCASDTILDALRGLDESVTTALVVAHAPGTPALASDLADRQSSDHAARSQIAHRFPPATIVRLTFRGPWSSLHGATLTHARVD